MGSQVPIGTGMFKLCQDENMRKEGERVAELSRKEKSPVRGKAVKGDKMKTEHKHTDTLLFDSIM